MYHLHLATRVVAAALCVSLLLPVTASADGFALRALPELLWGTQAEKDVPNAVKESLDTTAHDIIAAAVEGQYPEAWAEGISRGSAWRMERELEDMLHIGFRVSRYQVQRTQFGTAKTVFNVYITGSLFMVNLGSGEVLAARTLTSYVSREIKGHADRLEPADER